MSMVQSEYILPQVPHDKETGKAWRNYDDGKITVFKNQNGNDAFIVNGEQVHPGNKTPHILSNAALLLHQLGVEMNAPSNIPTSGVIPTIERKEGTNKKCVRTDRGFALFIQQQTLVDLLMCAPSLYTRLYGATPQQEREKQESEKHEGHKYKAGEKRKAEHELDHADDEHFGAEFLGRCCRGYDWEE